MCRLLAYLGEPRLLSDVLAGPTHSLVVQSYQPKEMTSGVVNADGFGVGWYHTQRLAPPFTYKNTLPIWNDPNLTQLGRYIESGCILANIRSATEPHSVSLTNCQPFTYDHLTFIHNGFIQDFRKTLYRPLVDRLPAEIHGLLMGNTDSEHIFGLFIDHWLRLRSISAALRVTIQELNVLAQEAGTGFSANIAISDGYHLVASRYARAKNGAPPIVPSLYWQKKGGITIASEPLEPDQTHWQAVPAQSLLQIGAQLDLTISPLG
jgi:ergothioneine biosynthesis protein EgtC